MILEWDEVLTKYQTPPDFLTHLNYASCLNRFSKGLKLQCNKKIKKKIYKSKILAKKINLINLTLKSINGEYQAILKSPEYAELCVSWISVKAYYLIFNLCLILDYLITGQEHSFSLTHTKLLFKFKDYIKRNEIIFNKKVFNLNLSCLNRMNYKVKRVSNIKTMNVNFAKRFMQIFKKLVDYKLEHFQIQEGIKNFRSLKNRQKKTSFLTNNTVNICEFFYWYRIKANYRDLEFLNRNITSNQFKDFYINYFELTINFYNAIKDALNDLAKIRLGNKIL